MFFTQKQLCMKATDSESTGGKNVSSPTPLYSSFTTPWSPLLSMYEFTEMGMPN